MNSVAPATSACSTDSVPNDHQQERQLTPQDLLSAYMPGDSLFVSPNGSWLGQGQAAVASARLEPEAHAQQAAGRLRAQVADLLQAEPAGATSAAVVMGAVPFDIRLPARLIRPQRVLRGSGVAPGSVAVQALGQLGAQTLAPLPQPAPEFYAQSVAEALARFQAGTLDKVVLARTLQLSLEQPLDSRLLLQRLMALNSRGYTYAVPLADATAHDANASATFLGATPELLVRRMGRRVIVNPLAGSTARRAQAADDQQVALELERSTKDRHEHALVIEAVAQALRPLCRVLEVPSQPTLVATDALWHLSTTLVGELADEQTSSLDLALALHPTPAVCGHPTDAAFAAIAELEPLPRGLFAGFVGWCDAHGDGEWAVSLRCAELQPHSVRLYAGAGIVQGSNPQAEVAETQTKFLTMLRALGLGADPR